MTPNRSHSYTVERVANKVRVEGAVRPLQLLLLRSEISLSSDALPAPEIFSLIVPPNWKN